MARPIDYRKWDALDVSSDEDVPPQRMRGDDGDRRCRLLTCVGCPVGERVRWALAKHGYSFDDERRAPGFHHAAVLSLLPSATEAPRVLLLTHKGEVIQTPTNVFLWIFSQSWNSTLRIYGPKQAIELERYFDAELLPRADTLWWRVVLAPRGSYAYAMLLRHLPRPGLRLAAVAAWPLARPFLARCMLRNCDPAAAAETVERVFVRVSDMLRDGRKYVCGEQLSGADYVFGSQAAVVLLLSAHAADGEPAARLGTQMPPPGSPGVPEDASALALRLRPTPAGKLAVRLCRHDRPRPSEWTPPSPPSAAAVAAARACALLALALVVFAAVAWPLVFVALLGVAAGAAWQLRVRDEWRQQRVLLRRLWDVGQGRKCAPATPAAPQEGSASADGGGS